MTSSIRMNAFSFSLAKLSIISNPLEYRIFYRELPNWGCWGLFHADEQLNCFTDHFRFFSSSPLQYSICIEIMKCFMDVLSYVESHLIGLDFLIFRLFC